MTNDPKYAPHLHNFVLIEGGHRAVTKYKRLMLRRIKWVEQEDAEMESSGSEDQAKESADMKCYLVWEGSTNVPQFGDKFRAIYGVKSETEGRKAFSEKTQYLWDAVLNFQPKRAIGVGEEDTLKEKMLESLR